MKPVLDSAQTTPASARGWWAVGVFAVIAVLSYTDRQILSLLVDPLHRDLGLTDTQLSIVQGAAFAVLYSFVGLPLGRLADILPRKAMLLAAVLLWSVGTLACGLAGNFWQLFAARLLVGIGEAGFAPAAVSLIGDAFPAERRATALGVFFTGMVIGSGSAIAIGGMLLGLAQQGAFASIAFLADLAPWRVVLVVLGTSGIAAAALLATIRDSSDRRFEVKNLNQHLAPADAFRPFREKLPLLFPLYAAMAIGSIVDYAILSWTPAYLSRQFAMSPAEIGASLGSIAVIAGLIGTPAAGALSDWYTRRFGTAARVKLAFLIALLGFLGVPIGLVATSTLALATVFAWIFISSVLGVIGIATVLEALPSESRGLATSTIAFCNTIVGLGLGPTLVALATDHVFGAPSAVGLAITTVIAPAIFLTCFFFYMAMQRWSRADGNLIWRTA